MKPQILFFDIGNTLVTGAGRSPRRLLAERLNLNDKETKRAGRLIMTASCEDPLPLVKTLRQNLPDRNPVQVHQVLTELWREQIQCVREIPHAGEILTKLKESGIKLGVISTTWHPFYIGFRKNCPAILKLLDYQLLSYRLGIKKPALALFEHALTLTGRPAAACWMIGDSYELDIEPASKVGMRTLWVLRSPEKEKTALIDLLMGKAARPDGVVQELSELVPFFQERTQRSGGQNAGLERPSPPAGQ